MLKQQAQTGSASGETNFVLGTVENPRSTDSGVVREHQGDEGGFGYICLRKGGVEKVRG